MKDLVIVGGGPSGMAAAYEASKVGASVLIIEKLDRVGGLARTNHFQGCLFDIGPHRFFTKNREIEDLFVTVTGEDLIYVSRQTRIFYDNKYFDYPLTPFNAFFGLGITESAEILASYAASRVRRIGNSAAPESFEEWIVDRFGRKLYETFFKTYTEKVWGIPCSDISAEWAAQRIKGLSLTSAVTNALFKPDKNIKSLIDKFIYPKRGAGQLYEKMFDIVHGRGGEIMLGTTVTRILAQGNKIHAIEVIDARGMVSTIEGKSFLISCPLTELITMLTPAPPPEVLTAMENLRYRHHIGVNLIVSGKTFPDNWLYIHSNDVKMARISNHKNFSPYMSSSPDLNPLTLEYFSFPGDGLWEADDSVLVELAIKELLQMNIIASRDQVQSGFVVRSEKAYPVISRGSERYVAVLKAYLDRFENMLPIGRSGMFKYNNQDHAMATGLLAARTLTGQGKFDPWLVNIDAEYHETQELK